MTDNQTIWHEVHQEYKCAHPAIELRCYVQRNNSQHYVEQCMTCGEPVGSVKKADPRVMLAAPGAIALFDETIRQQRWTEIDAEITRRRQLLQDEKRNRFWAEYNEYLKSGAWEQRRRMVLERDGYLCQSCRRTRATQAHHLTYDHWGNEPLFELVAVCKPCHDRITVMDRKRRGES